MDIYINANKESLFLRAPVFLLLFFIFLGLSSFRVWLVGADINLAKYFQCWITMQRVLADLLDGIINGCFLENLNPHL